VEARIVYIWWCALTGWRDWWLRAAVAELVIAWRGQSVPGRSV
jgi:hypothetical protein